MVAVEQCKELVCAISFRLPQPPRKTRPRSEKTKLHANAQMGAKEIKRYCAVNEDAEKLLEIAINKLGLSARAYSRVLKVGRTIADLAGADHIEAAHIAEAIQYRSLDRTM